MRIYCLSTMGYIFVLLLSGKGSLNRVWKGVGFPGTWQHIPSFLLVSALPPPPPHPPEYQSNATSMKHNLPEAPEQIMTKQMPHMKPPTHAQRRLSTEEPLWNAWSVENY